MEIIYAIYIFANYNHKFIINYVIYFFIKERYKLIHHPQYNTYDSRTARKN
jgi:hypothetical protein